MPVLKTPCPKCEASMRFTVDGEGDHKVTCLKCGHNFTATFESDEPPTRAKKADAKPVKGKAKKTTDDDDDDAPKKKKKKGAGDEDGKRKKLILMGAIAGVILLCGIGGIIYAVTSKDKTAQKAPDPVPDPTPEVKPNPNPEPVVNPNPPPPPKENPNPPPKENQPVDVELATTLPDPPRIRVNGSLVPTSKPLGKAPAIPPLAPDEDPFVRANGFKHEGLLPTLPALPKTGRPLLTLDSSGHTGIITEVFFTPKGERVITVAEDKAVRIWDPATNEVVKTVRFPSGPGKEGMLFTAALSPSGKRFAVAGAPLAEVQPGRVPIYIISPETGAQLRPPLEVGSAAITGLSFSTDGVWLGVGCENGAIQLVNVTSGVSYPAPPISKALVREVKYNPNPKAKLLATLGADKFVQIWNFANVAQNKDIPVQGATPTALAWSNDGLTLAIGSTTGEIALNTFEGKIIKTLPRITVGGVPLRIHQIRYLPQDREIAVAGWANAGWAGVINADTGKVRCEVKEHTNVVFALDVSPDGTQVVSSGGNQHETLIWKADDGKIQHRLQGTGNNVWAVAWSKDGKSIAFGNNSKRSGPDTPLPLEGTFRLDEFGVGDAPDPSKYTHTVESDEHVKLLTGPAGFIVQTTGREPTPMRLPNGEKIYSATVLPKGNAILVGGVQHLYLVTPSTTQVTKTFYGHSGNITSVTPSPDSRYFATGSNDQTIRIWARDRDEPVLSIFIAGREWIAWTPQGFYACSAQGERLIAWQINAGNVKFPQIHPAARFRPSLYQPALLKYLIPAGDLPRAMAMAKKFDKALVETTSVADVLPPEVTLDGFTEAEVKMDKDKATLTVKGRATSTKHPITAMRLLIDGRPFNGTAGVKRFENPQVTAEMTWEVPFLPGQHTVAVIADTPVSKGMSKVGAVVRAGDPPKPNLYVLAIGIADYPGKLKLTYGGSDAEMLAKAFEEKSKGAFAAIETKVLTDKAATKKGIREGLDWLKSKMKPQDVGIVSFSGHGTRDSFDRFHLVPVDVAEKDDCASCISGDEFKSRLDNMPGRLVAILDACHSGAVADKDRQPVRTDNLVRDLTAEDSGVIVMCASLGREYAIESKLTKAGFYTLGLVEGLSGHGDIDGDGIVYIHELDMYATARVRQLSGGKQNPTLGRPPTIKPFPIAKLTSG